MQKYTYFSILYLLNNEIEKMQIHFLIYINTSLG